VFVIGHLLSLHESRAFPELALEDGEQCLAAMLPDLLSCHDWGYTEAWSLVGAGVQAELVLAHMVGDAVVHYGQTWQGHERRSGWAYRRMGLIARGYDGFFEHAEACGWRAAGLDRDSRRGWAHTLVEYTVDQWLADHHDLTAMHHHVRAAATRSLAEMSWVNDLVNTYTIVPSKPLTTQPYRYCGALARTTQPDELHLRGLALKFGLCEEPEALDWLRSWLRGIWQAVGDFEMNAVFRSLATVTADPVGHGYPLDLAALSAIPMPGDPRWRIPATSSGKAAA
jgi:hypothetical protein